ncbi:methyltransferase type 11 [Clostridiaceae bacterium 14S0207]|nr:methyltransferase type 11 [Clostridiaceae bacterium 14S0207]
MKIGEFAERAGVTIRTLRYYDKIGLLKPLKKSSSGYRLYSEEDFFRLQQITTLKFLGLSLEEIHKILCETGENLEDIIKIQREYLENKKRHIESVIGVLQKTENQIKNKGCLETDKLIDIIKMTNMENNIIQQYKTEENLNLRKKFHSYNVNKIDWHQWCYDNMRIPKNARILELGCGTGELWYKNSKNIKKNWNIILSDLCENMIFSTKQNLKDIKYNFQYEKIDAQHIPYKNESFDVIIARHMLYLVPDIEKALAEIKRVLVKGGKLYLTTNSKDAMSELNELIEKFDSKLGLHNNGMCNRFDLEHGQDVLKIYFSKINLNILEGRILVDNAESVVSYKASSIKGRDTLVGEKRKAFQQYVQKYIDINKRISITTKAGIFEAIK